MTRPRVWVVGAGGHAKVVVDLIRAMDADTIAGVLDDDPARWGSTVLGVAVSGPATLEVVTRLGVDRAVLAVGCNRARAALAARFDGRITWAIAVHPKAVVAADAHIGRGAMVCAGAVIQSGATVGINTIINTSSSVDHDSAVGDFAHLAPGVHLGGGVTVGEGAMIGLGSVILPGRSVGAWATVGAGAVVVRDIPGGAVAIGLPARSRPPKTNPE